MMCHVEIIKDGARKMMETRIDNAGERLRNLKELSFVLEECGVWKELEQNPEADKALWLMLYSMP